MKTTFKMIIIAAISLIILLVFFSLYSEKPASAAPVAEAISTGSDRVKEEAMSISSDAMDEPSDKYTQPAESVEESVNEENTDDDTDTSETEETSEDKSYELPDQWEGEEG